MLHGGHKTIFIVICLASGIGGVLVWSIVDLKSDRLVEVGTAGCYGWEMVTVENRTY